MKIGGPRAAVEGCEGRQRKQGRNARKKRKNGWMMGAVK